MKKKVTIIDYGTGNILSVAQAFEHCGADIIISDNSTNIENADFLILPGVGGFKNGMKGLFEKKIIEPLKEFLLCEKPFMGICLGMQLLFLESDEFGYQPGLGLLDGTVRAIPKVDDMGNSHKIPHIGWNKLYCSKETDASCYLLKDIPENSFVYFVHSYQSILEDESIMVAHTHYDWVKIPSIVKSNNVFGCQFHPEKSGDVGLKLISNFLNFS